MTRMKGLSLGLAHELGLMAALTLSTLIVLLGGEMPPWMWLTALAPALSMGLARRDVRVPAVAGTVLAVGAIAVGVGTLLQGGIDSAVFAGGTTLLGLTVARLISRRTLAHDQQALLLSLILVFAGSVLNVGLSYFLVFVAYAIAAVWALSTRQLLAGAEETGASSREARARDDVITPLFFAASAGVSLLVLLAAVGIFVSFPRIGFGELGFLGTRESQLPPSVGFGGSPRGLSTSTTVIARVRGIAAESFEAGLYLRAITYDDVSFDAFGQSSPTAQTAPPLDQRANVPDLAIFPDAVVYEIVQTPVGGSLLFTLGYTRSAIATAGGSANPNRLNNVSGRDRHDELRAFAPLASSLRFQVRGTISEPGVVPPPPAKPPVLSDDDRARYLAAPTEDAAVRALLQTMLATATGSDDEARTTAVRNHLLRQFSYSLEDQVVGVDAPLRHFLLNARAGHCELFAGSFTLLLRMMDIPARVVGGFQGGALADDGSIVFQQRHAHAWVEWWKDGVGWIVDDATPQAHASRERLGGLSGLIELVRVFWDDRVVDYALEDQEVVIRGVMRALKGKHLGTMAKAAVVVGFVVVVIAVIVRRLRRRRDAATVGDRLGKAIADAVGRLSQQGVPESWTIAEVVAAHPHPTLQAALQQYERHRYGNEVLDVDVVDGLVKALRALRRPPAATPPAR